MNKLQDFPDLALSLKKLRLSIELDAISDQSILGYCVRLALMNKQPLKQIADTILDQYNDSPSVVLDVVPQQTIDLIKQIYNK
jgi:hypothetical protein